MASVTVIQNHEYLPKQVIDIFGLSDTVKTAGLVKAEREGRVPGATRKQKGKSSFRYWSVESLPGISKYYSKGFENAKKTIVISVYYPKGGVGKTTFSYNFCRILALYGLDVLGIGTDFQCSFSKSFGLNYDGDELPYSLYDVFARNEKLENIIHQSDIPNLHFVPESPELTVLDRWITTANNREHLLKKNIDCLKNKYDVIVIDCPPQWNEMVNNALIASDAIISPIQADGESYHSLKFFLPELEKFMEVMDKNFDLITFIPNLIKANVFTKSYQKNLNKYYADYIANVSFKDIVHVKEALSIGKSILEYSPNSAIAQDLKNLTRDLWSELIKCQKKRKGAK